ncbi:hypothetical protein ASPZODRAFT_161257 [Penicilliopsis zonata CBS 506.65]|uniref:Mitochondrial escape protein 2 n=1 Tax=Penicilliopsis zonata CBS 506.65 TaxID=1073090 RepID=A0A1L9SAK0_9EURO|nr:hypothetical protein ASPZODRAFT_161257 [Penicilliopsis zonata CBS 506.65]OJJ44166.1 hypothetical protein ASPZODRAFT_161257 [Penicilliopsis zonata CBS 506.65]
MIPLSVARGAFPPAGARTSSVKAGHIEIKDGEHLIFVNNIFPPKLQWLLRIPLRGTRSFEDALKRIDRPHIAASDPVSIIRRALPEKLPLEIKDIVPRVHEGGAFVKYSHGAEVDSTQVEDAIRAHLAEHPIRPWFNPFQSVEAARVLGRPWIEDLYRIPSQRLKIEFLPTTPESSAAELTQETLYSLLRPYGKLKTIERQPSDSKVVPRYAYVEFRRPKYAVMARNCLHGFVLPETDGGGKSGTKLKLQYERKIKLSMINNWLLSHPRIVLPILAAIVATITVIIFDPIRTFFIRLKIKASAQSEGNAILRWVQKQMSKASFRFGHHGKSEVRGLMAIWENLQTEISQLQAWLTENVETFIVVQGPRGSGKRELVLDQTLKDRKYKIVIDCKQIQDARGDAAKITKAAAQVGYRPVFSWMNSISSFIDLAAQGMIGTKAGFSETLDVQLSKIWQSTATALKQVALEDHKKDEKGAHLTEEEYLDSHPEKRPVVVIDNYLHNASEDDVVYAKITEWAAGLTAGNIAHVIFLTTDISFAKPLSKALPNQVFRSISLGDCSLDVGRRFVLNHLEREIADESPDPQDSSKLEDLDACIEALGGRVTDLEFMAQRIKVGDTPRGAVNRIIDQSASEILKSFILDTAADNSQHQWTREQVWHLIKALAHTKSGVMSYNQIILSDLFKDNGEGTLRSLEQAELISIISVDGSPRWIKPGKPIFQAVFQRLTENKALSTRLDLAILAQLISKQNKSIATYEEELKLLGQLPKQPRELQLRIQWLLNKVYAAQNKIAKYEDEGSGLEKTAVAVVVFSCIATRILSGLQSRSTTVQTGNNDDTRNVSVAPYWIPWVGHAPFVAWNPLYFISRTWRSVKEPVFGLYMGGVKQNVVLSPPMIDSVLLSRDVSSDSTTKYILEKVFGDRGTQRRLKPEDSHAIHQKIPSQFMREPFLSDASTSLVRLIERETPNLVGFCQSMVDQAIWERCSQVIVPDDAADSLVCEANMFSLVRNFVGHLTSTVFMGQAFVETFPGFLGDLWTLDNHAVALSMGVPFWIPLPGVSGAFTARERLLRSLTSFHQAFIQWDDGRNPGFELSDLDDVSEPIKERIRAFRDLGLSPRESAPAHLSLLWAMNANIAPMVFWTLLRILADPDLFVQIREEVAPFAKASRLTREETGFPFQEPPRISIDLDALLSSCPLLRASCYEALRLDCAPLSFRELTADVTIREPEEDAFMNCSPQGPRQYRLPKGEYVIIPHGVHQNDSAYFADPTKYDPSRFIVTDPDTQEKKADPRTVRPFSGGVLNFKLQQFSERELLAFVAAILLMWDIEPVGGKKWAIPGHKVATGAFLPSREIRVRIKSRV